MRKNYYDIHKYHLFNFSIKGNRIFTLIGVKDVQNTQKNAEFLSLQEYTKEAKKVIRSYTQKVAPTLTAKALADDDFISNVAYELAKADWKWHEGTNLNREAFRKKNGQYFILDYLARCNIKTSKKALAKLEEMSIDIPIDDLRKNHSFSEIIPCKRSLPVDHNIIKEDRLNLIEDLIKQAKLTKKQEKCLRMFYLEEKTLSEIAKEMKQTAPGIKQAVSRALVKIRNIAYKVDKECL